MPARRKTVYLNERGECRSSHVLHIFLFQHKKWKTSLTLRMRLRPSSLSLLFSDVVHGKGHENGSGK